ncbi:MAG: hypothetical protein K9W43_05875 [Candidatus Thorarchaeota archaeon]|nr:hypothetical protein [Candidatus Thorarchaeota archaeon]
MRKLQLSFVMIFSVLMLLTLAGPTGSNPDNLFTPISMSQSGASHSVANLDESSWWNVSYHYRRYVNLTDTNSTVRYDAPIHISVDFANNTCFKNSIRIVDSNGNEVPSQVYKVTYWEDPDYVKSATIFWYANIPADSTAVYWIYYSEDKSIEAASYDNVVWFARTTGTLSGKFNPNYWSFRGDWYNVTMYNEAGGKITNGAHLRQGASGWYWDWNWGTNRGSMHWNPDGLGGQGTSGIAPNPDTTFVNVEGPLFINYTTQVNFGSYAKMNVTYTFYKWGWIFNTYIKYTGTTSGSGRTDEWVFYPYLTTHAVEVAEDGTQTYYDNWAASSNKGKPAGFGWWNDNGISHGTVRISHNSWNTNPAYANNYDNYYYRWRDTSSYEYWDTYIPTVYAVDGTVLEETCVTAVWNGTEGLDGYMRIFNATSRYLPIFKAMGNVSSYSFRINVKDLGGANVANANVTLLNATTGERLYMSTGSPYTALTDSNGNVTFIGLQNETYRIFVWIDSRTWLDEQTGATGMNVTWSGDRVADGPFTPVSVTLDLASITIHLDDLMGHSMGTVGAESVQVRVYNASDPNPNNWRYLDYEYTDASGDLTFTRLPKCRWVFNFSYSDTDTGHIYQWADFGKYVSYEVAESAITGDLTRSWELPLVTIDFNVIAYDDNPVEDAYVRLSKRGTGDPIPTSRADNYNVTHLTDASGDVTFYRVLNGTWNVYVYKTDDFGQTAFNSTIPLTDIQNYYSTQAVLPLTSLRVHVKDTSGNNVPNAKIRVTANGETLVTAYSDSSGWYNFTFIRANDTSLSYYVYVSKLSSQDQGPAIAGRDFLAYTEFELAPLTYDAEYNELNCTITTGVWAYGDNQTFTIGWYNRTDTPPTGYRDDPLSDYTHGWLNFTIKFNSVVIGRGTWNSSGGDFIIHSTGINFTVVIDTIYFHMNASNTPYVIEFNSYHPDYNGRNATYTVTVIITVADTTAKGSTSGSVYWSDGFARNYSLYTTPEGRDAYNLTELSYANYTIYDSVPFSSATKISSGVLVHLGNGIYRFSDAVLNGSDVGTYYVYIWLYKYNYVNQTVTVEVTIKAIPTTISWTTPPTDYTWGPLTGSAIIQFNDMIHGMTISATGATITMQWINTATGEVVVTENPSSFTYLFLETIVYNGTWRLHAYVSKANYISADNLSAVFTVSPQNAELLVTSATVVTIDWGTTAVFDLTYRTSSGHAPIPGASIIDIAWDGEVSLIDNGAGTYSLRLLATQPAENATVTFIMWLANRTSDTQSVTVNILIPLAVQAVEGQSIQNPVQEYWTHNFTVHVISGDESNGSVFVSGVTITYDFPAGGSSGVLTENTSGGYYWLQFPASDAPGPGVYSITLTASRAGCMTQTATLYIEVLATPTVAAAENQLLTVYYADAYLLNFSWFTEIDGNVGIDNPDGVQIELWKGTTRLNDSINGVVGLGSGDYQFLMDTRALGMSADSPIYPTSYYFIITIHKVGYANPLAVTIIILVLQTPVKMTVDSVNPVVWSEQFTIRAHLRDVIHDEYVWTDAEVTLKYGSFSGLFTSLGNGTFVYTGDSSQVFPSSATPLEFTIEYTLPNYIDGSVTSTIVVNPRPAYITMIDAPDSSYDWRDDFTVRLQIYLNGTTTQVNMTAYYYWVEFPSINGTMTYNGVWYEATIDTGKVPAGSWTLRLHGLRDNYTVTAYDVPIVVRSLEATLVSTTGNSISAIFGVNHSAEVRLVFSYDSNVLEGADVTFTWAGLLRTASYADGAYVFQFDPSGDSSLTVPGTYILNFTAKLMNYTTVSKLVTLRLAAATEIQGGPYRVEAEQTLQLVFKYWDTVNDRAVASAATAQLYYQIGDGAKIPLTADQFDGEKYTISLAASDIGGVSPDPYLIRIYASAPGYQNWTESNAAYIQVYVDSPTVDVLGYRVQRDTLFLVLLMTGAFVGLVAGATAIRRWRIPYQIKQINRALKDIERSKHASVENIKSMGQVISELLAPGLAELDIPAPTIEMVHVEEYEEILGGETEDLLEGLDALDAIGAEEEAEVVTETDIESELAAEIESEIAKDEEAARETSVEESSEAAPVESEVEPEAESDEGDLSEAEEPEVESEDEAEAEIDEGPVSEETEGAVEDVDSESTSAPDEKDGEISEPEEDDEAEDAISDAEDVSEAEDGDSDSDEMVEADETDSDVDEELPPVEESDLEDLDSSLEDSSDED